MQRDACDQPAIVPCSECGTPADGGLEPAAARWAAAVMLDRYAPELGVELGAVVTALRSTEEGRAALAAALRPVVCSWCHRVIDHLAPTDAVTVAGFTMHRGCAERAQAIGGRDA